jgi:hypothetical protein
MKMQQRSEQRISQSSAQHNTEELSGCKRRSEVAKEPKVTSISFCQNPMKVHVTRMHFYGPEPRYPPRRPVTWLCAMARAVAVGARKGALIFKVVATNT